VGFNSTITSTNQIGGVNVGGDNNGFHSGNTVLKE